MNAGVREEEIRKLARVMNDAIDGASIQAGLLKPGDVEPFSRQPQEVKAVLLKSAEAVYDQLVYDRAVGEIRVLPSQGGRAI